MSRDTANQLILVVKVVPWGRRGEVQVRNVGFQDLPSVPDPGPAVHPGLHRYRQAPGRNKNRGLPPISQHAL